MHSDELWQEFDLQGEPIMNGGMASGDEPRDKMYGAACVWLYRRTENGLEILFQKRSENIYNGGKYDFSAGGHINYQEAPLDAAVRECREEIGVVVESNKLTYELCLNVGYGFLYVYSYDWTGRKDEFHFDDQEVSEVKWVPIEDLGEFREKFVKDPIKNIDIYFDVVKRRA